MFDSDDVRKRCRIVYDRQVDRQRAKLEKAAGKGVKLDIPRNQVLPYSFQEFFDWVWHTYGTGVHQCPHCTAAIDFRTMQFDHILPIKRGGEICIANLQGICERCNALKGEQTPEEFTQLLEFLSTCSPAHRRYLESRIRGGAVANRLRGRFAKAAGKGRGRVQQSRFNLNGDDKLGPF